MKNDPMLLQIGERSQAFIQHLQYVVVSGFTEKSEA